uniref:Uncharacterized protein n=1 Tax=Myotis myotis TaxID=51298 RepID=A0A7J7ZZB5_MYOMY|nr:hypothetical protein mMyoMyo1_009924 [Myotis myotis]
MKFEHRWVPRPGQQSGLIRFPASPPLPSLAACVPPPCSSPTGHLLLPLPPTHRHCTVLHLPYSPIPPLLLPSPPTSTTTHSQFPIPTLGPSPDWAIGAYGLEGGANCQYGGWTVGRLGPAIQGRNPGGWLLALRREPAFGPPGKGAVSAATHFQFPIPAWEPGPNSLIRACQPRGETSSLAGRPHQ